ncbi:anhydro-N-acetylmuramic acid kinase [Microlunatus soli]|uniref:Anhydro-N-acetylmuramic acid kinase n=1 Tax=Microlunatus soli TaxID=630515 RepID=A0A1H1RHE2_9ACTN|nr:anhydro-N-acetylmuramic acid kinase [Microlunatus soli]SDS34319.1 anhydro-N-acetylmuramic acid kinase [Microlunatus soli]
MTLRVAGMMSGTSYDAVDVAVADFDQDGELLTCTPLGMISRAVAPELRARISELLPPNGTSIEQVCRLDTELGQLFADVAGEAVQRFGDVDLVVSHGQTVFHWVRDSTVLGTLQLGSPAWIAETTGVAVLSDVRTRDITRGGQGAPLAAVLDALLVLSDDVRRGSLNLGGIANITVQDSPVPGTAIGAPEVIAYDLGPAGALLDLVIGRHTGGAERMDTDGRRAAHGRVHDQLLERLLAEPYYRLDPPKSTGKELFHTDYLDAIIGDDDLELDDLVATLTELTARLVGDACHRHQLAELVVAGGGVRNPTLMDRIGALTDGVAVRPIEDFGIPAQAKEGYLMALIGYLSWHGLPGTIGTATGASSLLGSFTPGAAPLRLPTTETIAPSRMLVVPPDERI